jgi:hypothetical protein
VHNIVHTAVETTPQFPEARIGTYTDRIIKIRGRRSNKSTDLYPERRRGGASRCPADLGGGGGSPDRRRGSGAGNDRTQRKCARDAGGISEPRNGGRRRRRRRGESVRFFPVLFLSLLERVLRAKSHLFGSYVEFFPGYLRCCP